MSDKELRVAHERIAVLEALLTGGEVKRSLGLDIGNIAVAILFALVLAVVVPLGEPPPLPAPPPRPLTLAGNALMLADAAAPIFAVSEGTRYAIVRGWRSGYETAPLYVAAFDRADWHLAWVSEAFKTSGNDRGSLTLRPWLQLAVGGEQIDLSIAQGITIGRATADAASPPLPPAVDGGRYVLSATPTGEYHLMPFDIPIPGLGYGSKIGSLSVDGGEVVITANDSLYILDATTGALKKRIDLF